MIVQQNLWSGFKSLYSHTPESMFALANQLASGKSLIEALENLSLVAGSRRMAKTAEKSAELLKQGKTPEEVFANKALHAFSPRVRYVLATPLPDKIKGQMLRGLMAKSCQERSLMQALVVPVFTLLISLFVSITLVSFVFPQFTEILRGMRLELTPFLKFVFTFDILALQPAALAVLSIGFLAIVFMFFLIKYVLKINLLQEKGRLLRLMAEIDFTKRVEIMRYLSSRVLFPIFYQKLSAFKKALDEGNNIEEAFETAEFSPTLTWFLTLGLKGEKSSEMLHHGANFYSEVFKSRTTVMTTCFEISATLLTGIFIGSLILAVFSAIGLILEHLAGQVI
jgi:type II secretory pathway component PulF